MKPRGKIVIYEAKDGWRWHLKSSNGKITAESGEAYSTKRNVKNAVNRLSINVFTAKVVIDEASD